VQSDCYSTLFLSVMERARTTAGGDAGNRGA
jgi:hypothetical protein